MPLAPDTTIGPYEIGSLLAGWESISGMIVRLHGSPGFMRTQSEKCGLCKDRDHRTALHQELDPEGIFHQEILNFHRLLPPILGCKLPKAQKYP